MDRFIRKSFIILCLFATALSYAHPRNDLFDRANDAYQKKQWGEALRLYESIDQKGCAAWYNMGNCFYKLGNRVRAIICWKRAMPGASVGVQRDIAKNLAVAYEKLGHKKDGLIYTQLEQRAYRIPPRSVQLLFLLCWYALFIFFWFGPRRRPLFFYGGIAGLSCAIALLGALLWSSYAVHAYERGQLTKESASLFAGPHEQYHAVGTVSLLDELRIDAKRTGWYKVAGSNKQGWIPSADIALI